MASSSSKLLFFLISPFFVHFLALGATAQLQMLYHLCYPNAGKYTTNSPYKANLNHLLNSLPNTGRDYGFYNFSYGKKSPNKAYAIGICRPDMDTKSCRNCISVASKKLKSLCPNFYLAIAGFDDGGSNYCMLRYANYNIFRLMENAPYFFVYSISNITENLVKFKQTRNGLLKRLNSVAAARCSPHKYAVGEELVSGILRVYALVQCNYDLSEADCNRCLDDTITLIPKCCDNRAGGRVITPSCSFRYELSKFYKPSIEKPPVSATPSTDLYGTEHMISP